MTMRSKLWYTTASRLPNSFAKVSIGPPRCFCIPLFRPPRHSRTPPAADPAGEPRLFLPRCPPLRRHRQGSVAKTDRRVSPLGGSLRPKTSNPHGMGRKGRAQGGLCPPLPAADGTAEFLWRLFHSEEHGGRALLPIRGAAVPSRRPRLPHHRPPALPLYSLLLLYPGRGVGSPFFVRGFFPAFPDHLLPERPSLYRTGIAPPQYRLPQGR